MVEGEIDKKAAVKALFSLIGLLAGGGAIGWIIFNYPKIFYISFMAVLISLALTVLLVVLYAHFADKTR